MFSSSGACLALSLLGVYNLSIYERNIILHDDIFTVLFSVYLPVNSVIVKPEILDLEKYKLCFKFLSSC